MPLTIDASEDFMDHQESMTSPIVINDKMLSHSAVSPITLSSSSSSSIAPARQHVNSTSGGFQQKINNVDAFGSFMDVEALNKILMDLTPSTPDYEANLF